MNSNNYDSQFFLLSTDRPRSAKVSQTTQIKRLKRELQSIISNFVENNKKFDGYYSTEVCDFVMMNTFT